jgi:hypothetical protein
LKVLHLYIEPVGAGGHYKKDTYNIKQWNMLIRSSHVANFAKNNSFCLLQLWDVWIKDAHLLLSAWQLLEWGISLSVNAWISSWFLAVSGNLYQYSSLSRRLAVLSVVQIVKVSLGDHSAIFTVCVQFKNITRFSGWFHVAYERNDQWWDPEINMWISKYGFGICQPAYFWPSNGTPSMYPTQNWISTWCLPLDYLT